MKSICSGTPVFSIVFMEKCLQFMCFNVSQCFPGIQLPHRPGYRWFLYFLWRIKTTFRYLIPLIFYQLLQSIHNIKISIFIIISQIARMEPSIFVNCFAGFFNIHHVFLHEEWAPETELTCAIGAYHFSSFHINNLLAHEEAIISLVASY